MYTEFFNQIYGTVNGLPVIAIGAQTYAVGTTIHFLVLDDDGVVKQVDPKDFVADVRFRDGQWHDVTPGAQVVEE